MSRNGAFLLLLTVVLAARVPGAEAANRVDSLTVEACVELARHRAPAVVAADLLREGAAYESSAVAKNGRPNLAFVGRALIAPKGFYDPAITNLGEYETKLVLDYALLDGGPRSRASARGALELASARLEAATQARDIGLQAADLATTVLRLREVESSQGQSLAWLDRLGTLMRGAVRAGARSTTDSVRIALERNTAEAALTKPFFDRRPSEIDLMALMGLGADSTLVVLPPETPERPPVMEDSLRIMASIDQQPEISLARVEEQRRQIDLIEAKRTRAPSVDLSLDAGLAGTGLTEWVPGELRAADPDATFADRLRRDLGASATINVRAPITQSGARQSKMGKTMAVRAAAMKRESEVFTQRKVALDLLARWHSAYHMLETASRASVGADQNLLTVKSLYSGGAIQLLDLLDARRVQQEALERLAEGREESRSAPSRVGGRG